ncbi:helix-turn-helix transcriptional regulator [Streptomyces sp. NPDC004673]
MMSKFYFIRVFQRTTGVTPGRFLSAVRLRAATLRGHDAPALRAGSRGAATRL